VNPWVTEFSPDGAASDFVLSLAAAVGFVGLGLVTVYGLTLVWPFITGWMAKFRRAGNGRAGS
jgi:hypothetical protein